MCRLMSKMPYIRKQHRHVAPVAQIDGILIAFGSAGLHNAVHTRIDQLFRSIREGKETVGRSNWCRGLVQPIACFFNGNATRGQSINLSRARAS